jgi:hypothetical protein
MSDRRETLYRVMYESFTPKMMHRTPMWLKRRIAATLGWRLVVTLDADTWLRKLFAEKPGELAPIAISMFESCAGGTNIRWTFFSRRWLWRQAKRIWTGDADRKGGNKPAASLKAPGMLPEESASMDTAMDRRRFR